MTNAPSPALLPAGFADLLPSDAALEAKTVEHLLQRMVSMGYQRVKPPLLEFEDTLLAGTGAAVTSQTFRLMDPVSQRMMGLRADMTPQVARIAAARLSNTPRPLRLCYAGDVLRVRGGQIRPERQFVQAGAELIGVAGAVVDAEVILTALEALDALHIPHVSVDIAVPTLVTALLADADVASDSPLMDRLRLALDRKDPADVAALAEGLGAPLTAQLVGLIRATGPVDEALQEVAALQLPDSAKAVWQAVSETVTILQATLPDLVITCDPVEQRGYEYHAGLTFTLFAKGVRGELGSGGHYRTDPSSSYPDGEPATGFSLFLDSLLRALPRTTENRRVYLPVGTSLEDARRLRAEGWETVSGLTKDEDLEVASRAQRCAHLYDQGRLTPIDPTESS